MELLVLVRFIEFVAGIGDLWGGASVAAISWFLGYGISEE